MRYLLALIDLGVDDSLFKDVKIEQFRFHHGSIYKEKNVDYLGHGIYNLIKEVKIYELE